MNPVPRIAVLIAVINFPASLGPPRRCRLLTYDDLVEKTCCFGQALTGREQAIFVFDRYDVIVAKHPQRGDELAPEFNSVTIATGAEDPRTFAFVGVRLGIQHPRAHYVH